MGRIKDIVEGGVSSFKDAAKNVTGSISSAFRNDTGRGRPDGSTLGLSTPTKMTGNTAIGPSGGSATQFGTTTSSGRLTDVHAVGSRTPRNPGDPSSYSRSSGGDKTSGTTGTKTSPSTSSRNPNVSTDKSGRGPSYAKGGKVERTKMAKKKLPREEMAEFKKGKYMGGPAEEKAEKAKKKPAKRAADGGMMMQGASNKMRPGVMPGTMRPTPPVAMPQRPYALPGRPGASADSPMSRPGPVSPGGERPGTFYTNMPMIPGEMPSRPNNIMPPGVLPSKPGTITPPGNRGPMKPVQRPPAIGPAMRGGGLARKGVGQALKNGGAVKRMATGGLVKGGGCITHGVKPAKVR